MTKTTTAALLGFGTPKHSAAWLASADTAAAFTAVHGHVPSETAVDPAEKKVGRWLAGMRRDAETLAGIRADYLDAQVPGWRVNQLELLWDEHLDALREFHEEADRLPSEDACGLDERALGQWLAKQCEQNRRPGGLTGNRAEKLDAVAPGWQLKLAERKWLDDATELGLFMALNTRRPSRKSKDLVERTLGVWLHNMRRRLDGSQVSHGVRIAVLDVLADGWR